MFQHIEDKDLEIAIDTFKQSQQNERINKTALKKKADDFRDLIISEYSRQHRIRCAETKCDTPNDGRHRNAKFSDMERFTALNNIHKSLVIGSYNAFITAAIEGLMFDIMHKICTKIEGNKELYMAAFRSET